MHLIYHEKYHIWLVLMQESSCNASYSNMHIDMVLLSVIIKLMQPTYHHVDINICAYMITHAADTEANANPSIWKVMWARGGQTWWALTDDYMRRGKKRM